MFAGFRFSFGKSSPSNTQLSIHEHVTQHYRDAPKTKNELLQIEKIKVGNPFWLSTVGGIIALIGIVFLFLFGFILYTGKGVPAEMSLIYYVEIMHTYVYYGFGISMTITLFGIWLSKLRIWTKTDLIIENDRIEFVKNGKKVDLPKRKILKLELLKSYLFKDNKVLIRTIGLKRYLVRIDNSVYNKLIDIYNDRFYEK